MSGCDQTNVLKYGIDHLESASENFAGRLPAGIFLAFFRQKADVADVMLLEQFVKLFVSQCRAV